MSELKPCPFCGGQPGRFLSKQNLDEDSYYISYECTKKDHSIRVSGDSDAEAIDAWNTRYEPTCKNVFDGCCENGFECSVCGNEISDCEAYYVHGTWNYCSKCGRKVVS